MAKEKAWTNFHSSYIACMEDLYLYTENYRTSFTLCKSLFHKLLDKNFQKKSNTSSKKLESVSQKDIEIVAYIGGSLICSLKKNKKNKHILQLIEHFKLKQEFDDNEELNLPSYTQLIQTLDRGGLQYPSEQAQTFFMSLESKILEVCGDSSLNNCSKGDFITICSEDSEVREKYNIVLDDEDFDELKNDLFVKFVKGYFNVRVHHECKMFMERYRNRKALSKHQKGLRKSLQKKV